MASCRVVMGKALLFVIFSRLAAPVKFLDPLDKSRTGKSDRADPANGVML